MVNLDIKEKMNVILNVGQILAENGAATDKIINCAKRVAKCMQIPEANFNLKVRPAILFLNVTDGENSHLAFRNYESRGVDMNIINLIGALTVKAVEKSYSPQKFQDVLERIVSKKKIYSHTKVILATGLFCGAFCFVFGGDLFAAGYTAICSSMGKFFQIQSIKYGINHFLAIAIAAFVATFSAYLSHFLPTETVWLPLISCSLFLIPGIPIVNAITDSLNGFLLNALVKWYHSFLIAFSMTVGIIFAVSLGEGIEGITEINLTNLTLLTHHSIFELFLAGIIISISFSTFINIPKRILPLLGVLGVVALIIKNLLIFELNLTPELATFIAALFIGIVGVQAKKYTGAPTQVLTVPAIISFVPGVLIYRFLSSCIYIKYFNAEEFFYEMGFGIDALQIILAMTIGVTLPNLLAKKFLRKAGKK